MSQSVNTEYFYCINDVSPLFFWKLLKQNHHQSKVILSLTNTYYPEYASMHVSCRSSATQKESDRLFMVEEQKVDLWSSFYTFFADSSWPHTNHETFEAKQPVFPPTVNLPVIKKDDAINFITREKQRETEPKSIRRKLWKGWIKRLTSTCSFRKIFDLNMF